MMARTVNCGRRDSNVCNCGSTTAGNVRACMRGDSVFGDSAAAPNPMTTARRISKISPVAADEMLPICRPFFASFV